MVGYAAGAGFSDGVAEVFAHSGVSPTGGEDTHFYNRPSSPPTAYSTTHSSASDRSSYNRAIYDEAQLRSSFTTGGIYHNASSLSRRAPQTNVNASFTSSNTGSGSGLTSSLRSGGASGGAAAPRTHPGVVSLSGNPLVHVRIEEEEELELDEDEIRQLAGGVAGSDGSNGNNEFTTLSNDSSTIGTTRSTQSRMSDSRQNFYLDGNPANNAILYDPKRTDADEARAKIKEFLFSPPFRRTLFLGICFVLLGLGVLLTLENFMRVKTAQDWIEPHWDKYPMQGGNDWTFGSDAPKPLEGAVIDHSLELNIADWARGTVRIPTNAGLDGYGSVALSETVMFTDVPFFWGLPFSGGSILESVFGQCLGLVQASDGKGLEEGANGMHLSTSFAIGRKYLNVDLSTPEGIEKAGALELGSSGMADVVHSPLLHEASGLFSRTNQGRLFVLVRHPVEREFARFRYLRRLGSAYLLEEADKSMPYHVRSYSEFADSKYASDNWMTRTLVGKGQDDVLTVRDMQSAKELLRLKALVGLHSDMMGAVRHYARYFGWDHALDGGKLNNGTLACFESTIAEGMKEDAKGGEEFSEEETKEGSVAWRKILDRNRFDAELHAYSQQLYKFQIALS
ncbi:hypothetical protein ACHAXT_013262 [Thalassiosira profunda]